MSCFAEKDWGRLDTERSWVFNASLATLADEITTVGTSPSCKYINGPNFSAMFRREMRHFSKLVKVANDGKLWRTWWKIAFPSS